MEPDTPSVDIRPAQEADLPAILDIYNDAILNSTASFETVPRTLGEERQWLREHGHPYTVLAAIHDGDVVGWASLSPFRPKPAYRLTVEDSVYVRADFWGKGLGALLLARLLEVAASNGFHTVIALIVGDNAASLRLHRGFGFRRVGVEREVGYKFDRWLDVVIMQKTLE
jgi:L-amino acid N-acyltransferase YncA